MTVADVTYNVNQFRANLREAFEYADNGVEVIVVRGDREYRVVPFGGNRQEEDRGNLS